MWVTFVVISKSFKLSRTFVGPLFTLETLNPVFGKDSPRTMCRFFSSALVTDFSFKTSFFLIPFPLRLADYCFTCCAVSSFIYLFLTWVACFFSGLFFKGLEVRISHLLMCLFLEFNLCRLP